MYAAIDLAKYILSKCVEDKRPISNLQLQKILFYIQKAFLQDDRLAFTDEIEAWQFGPVVPNVYYRFCGFGAMPITHTSSFSGITDEDMEIIDLIVEKKRVLKPWDLVRETHAPNGAWNRVYDNGRGNRKVISTELIKTAG